MRWTGSSRSAELFEVLGRLCDLVGEAAEFGRGRVVVCRGDEVLCGAAELEEPVLQGRDLGVGENDGVFGQSAPLEGGAALVGALATGLPTVAAAPADVAALFEPPAAPSAVLRRSAAARFRTFCFSMMQCGQVFGGRLRVLGHFPHGTDPSWPSNDHADATTEVHTSGVPTLFPYLADPLPRAFAHRGWHLGDLEGLENSLPAFRQAVTEGYRYVETDVHATSDGVVVVHHDAALDRTTDGSGLIGQQTWAQLRTVKIDGREPLSRLEDVLEELPEARFNIDVKSNQAVEPFVRVVERTGAHDRVAAASFSDARLARIRKLAGPKLVTAMGPRSVAVMWANGFLPLISLRALARGAMAQVPVRQGRLKVVDRAFLRQATRVGIEVHTWTVDDPAEMRLLLDLGVHGIVTDRPDLLREVLIERGTWP